jgi:hypothetical protein
VVGDREGEAEVLVKRFVRRALRRPVSARDYELPLAIVRDKLGQGWEFSEAMIAAYRAVLCSPDFLLIDCRRKEGSPKLDGHGLASRLAYFLWASPPDEELTELALKGSLGEREVLRGQVERMLTDPRADRFVAHFLDYWLDLRNAELTQPDLNLYPEYKHLDLESMLAETRAYFREMIREDLGVAHVVDSDFAMLNSALAELYDLPAVQGSAVRRVALPEDSVRGGLLTQASLLKITANGTTTSPVTRGVFVLDRLLGDPAPPPPEAVAAVEPDLSGATTIREQLAKHRADPSCASCHRKIDPPGFALESFDVRGAWRESYRAGIGEGVRRPETMVNAKRVLYGYGPPVDSTGQMSDGRTFGGIKEFRVHLLRDERILARNLLERLIVYSTGSPVRFAEREDREAMLDRLADRQFGLRSMIHEVIQSDLFLDK